MALAAEPGARDHVVHRRLYEALLGDEFRRGIEDLDSALGHLRNIGPVGPNRKGKLDRMM
jgi:hypothetical protein